ncbi:MAG: hypothetical protein ACOYXW_01340 [Actinomycetota bacterium]
MALLLLTTVGACSSGEDAAATSAGFPLPQVTASTYEEYDGLFADWRASFVECARSEGMDASVPVDGNGIDNGSSPDRPVAEGIGLDRECIERVGVPPQAPPLTEEVLSGLYDLSLAQAQCLRDAGYPVTPAPSREVWMESYTSSSPAWLPLEAVFASGGDVPAAVAACPDPDPRDVAP